MTLAELIDQWTAIAISAADVALYFAGLLGILFVVRALMQAHTASAEGQSPTRYYVAASIGGALTCVGVIAGAVSRMVVG